MLKSPRRKKNIEIFDGELGLRRLILFFYFSARETGEGNPFGYLSDSNRLLIFSIHKKMEYNFSQEQQKSFLNMILDSVEKDSTQPYIEYLDDPDNLNVLLFIDRNLENFATLFEAQKQYTSFDEDPFIKKHLISPIINSYGAYDSEDEELAGFDDIFFGDEEDEVYEPQENTSTSSRRPLPKLNRIQSRYEFDFLALFEEPTEDGENIEEFQNHPLLFSSKPPSHSEQFIKPQPHHAGEEIRHKKSKS